MNIAIVGSGQIGGTLGSLWARAGHRLFYSFSHDEAKLERLAREAGNGSRACSPYDAVNHAEVVLFAPPWRAVDEAMKLIGRIEGKVVIDTTNPYVDAAMNLQQFDDGDSSSENIARRLEGARIVKAFNTLRAQTLAERAGQGLVIFYASDFPVVKKHTVAPLIEDAGFVPFDVGPLREGKKQEPNTARYLREVTLDQAQRLADRPNPSEQGVIEPGVKAAAGRDGLH